MNIFDALRKKEPFEVIHHVALVEAPLDVVGAQLAVWPENAWWSFAPLGFKAITFDGMRAGARWEGSFKSFFPIRWHGEVAEFVANTRVRSVLDGFFKGTELLSAEERFNGIKVEYHLTYEIVNPVNQLLWSLFVEESFIKATQNALKAFKAQCEKAK